MVLNIKLIYGKTQQKTSNILINRRLLRIKKILMCKSLEFDMKTSEAGDMMNY